jgi:amino acid adenylation domain-containing protein
MFIPQLFEEQALTSSNRVAAIFQERALTYGTLNTRANRLAHYLRSLGVGPETIVGICMERCTELLVALLGVLKAGGACLTLDPTYPSDRLRFMVEDAHPSVLLTQHRLAGRFAEIEEIEALDSGVAGFGRWLGKRVVLLDRECERIAQQRGENPSSQITSGNLCFVFYTSGSTGRPKAVMWYHTERDGLKSWQEKTYQLTDRDRHLLKAPIGFTLVSKEAFLPLLTGGEVVIVPNGMERDIKYLVDLIGEHQISIITLVPSMLRALIEQDGLEKCASLRHVCTFGEALTPRLQQEFFDRLGAELNVTYGTTEAPSMTFLRCDRQNPERRVRLGTPLPEKRAYLLNDRLERVGVGEQGEIFLAGSLARGYLGHPDLTAEKFLPNPLEKEPGARLYKTGDLGRFLTDGSIEFIGRVDHQIKVRGVRVEPAEVERVIRQHPAVLEAVLIAQENKPEHVRLIAYIVPRTASTPSSRDLRRYLVQHLPDYLIPAGFVFLEALPLNHHGKIDRTALPMPDHVRPDLATAFVAPRSPLEKQIAEIWREVLGLDCIGVHDNFLELGGDSLLAAQLISRVTRAFHLDLPLPLLFQSATVSDMALLIVRDQSTGSVQTDLEDAVSELESISDEQARRLLLEGQAQPKKSHEL